MSIFSWISVIFFLELMVICGNGMIVWVGPEYILFLDYDSCPVSGAQLKSITMRPAGAVEPALEYFYFCENNHPKIGWSKSDCKYWTIGNQICLQYNQTGSSIKNITPSSCDEEILCVNPKNFDSNVYLNKMLTGFDSNRDVYAQTVSMGVYNQTLVNKTNQDYYDCWKNKDTSLCEGSPTCRYSSINTCLTYNSQSNQCFSTWISVNNLFVEEIKSVLYRKKIATTYINPNDGDSIMQWNKILLIILLILSYI